MTLDDILAVEDDDAFGSVVCPDTGILAWPAIRNELLRLIVGDLVYRTASPVDLAPTYRPAAIVVGAARSAIHNVLHRPSASDILIVGTGAGLLVRDGQAFNRYTDYFADCFPDRSWTMEGLFGGAWHGLPRTNRRLGYLAARRLSREVEGRLTSGSRHRRMIADLVDLAAARGRDRLGWEVGEQRREKLVTLGARRLATYPSESRFVSRLLARVRPRIALVEEGCYGRMAVFNAAAKRAGIMVAEFQHGVITRGHDAYNVAPRVLASADYRLTQPTAFLAYGTWWAGQFNAPVGRREIVGNPHRSETLRSWNADVNRDLVVVLGDGVETGAHLELTTQLARALPAPLRVVFRPHPREQEVVNSARCDVEIDSEPDLYRTFARAAAVIAEASTGLFEAIGLVSHVLVWDTPKSRFYLGDHPLRRFDTPAEAAGHLDGTTADPAAAGHDAFWAAGWRRPFLEFIEGAL